MGLFKKLSGFLGLARDEEAENNSDLNGPSSSPSAAAAPSSAAASQAADHLPRKGFGVPVQVPVDRGPILFPCTAGDGGVQGVRWYAMRLRVDEDGDVADEFLDEVSPDMSASMEEDHGRVPQFQVKYSTRPAKVRNQTLSHDGKLQHFVEFQGTRRWL